MKKRILLVQVPSKTAMAGFGSYNLACLASQVEDLAEVQIYDAGTRKTRDVMEVVNSFSPDMVGLSAFLTANVPATLELGQALKASSKAWVIAGGHGATSVPDLLLESGTVDMVVRGEGELTFRELVEAWTPKGILGLSYRENGTIVHNPSRPVISNLDNLPFPSFHLLNVLDIVVHQFETSRGCPNQCTFCDASRFYNHVWRGKSPERVVEEIKFLVNNYGAYAFFPTDDNITRDMNRLGEICDLILKYNLPVSIMAQARADAIIRHPEVVELMARAGFHMLVIGIESANQSTLTQVHKDVTLGIIEEAIAILKRNNIGVDGAVILGLPHETREMMLKTVDYAVSLEPETVGFNTFSPYPGTDLYDQCRDDGLLLTDDWTHYDEYHQVVKTPDWPQVCIADIRREACKRFYNRPEWVRTNLQVIPGQEVKAMFAKGAWVTFSAGIDFEDLDTWNRAFQGFADIVNAELEQQLPDYSAIIRLKTDCYTLFLPIHAGRLGLLVDDCAAWDFTLISDQTTLESLFIQMTLDASSAFMLHIRTDATLQQLMDFIRWVNALQKTLDLHVGGAAFERPSCLEDLNNLIIQHSELAAKLTQRLTIKLHTSAGDLLLKGGQGKIVDLQLIQPGERLRKIDREVSCDDAVAIALLNGGTRQWLTFLEQLCNGVDSPHAA